MVTLSLSVVAVGLTTASLLLVPRLGASVLVASWTASPGDIGIPGITKTYKATLTNSGLFPVRITVCDYMTDAAESEQRFADSIERWDRSRGRWQHFWGIPRQDFCNPSSLVGVISPKTKMRLLWPRQSITNPFIAIQASDGLQLNDSLRFTITPFFEQADIVIVTTSFKVDELPTPPRSEDLR